jgi:hypothetical protein
MTTPVRIITNKWILCGHTEEKLKERSPFLPFFYEKWGHQGKKESRESFNF